MIDFVGKLLSKNIEKRGKLKGKDRISIFIKQREREPEVQISIERSALSALNRVHHDGAELGD